MTFFLKSDNWSTIWLFNVYNLVRNILQINIYSVVAIEASILLKNISSGFFRVTGCSAEKNNGYMEIKKTVKLSNVSLSRYLIFIFLRFFRNIILLILVTKPVIQSHPSLARSKIKKLHLNLHFLTDPKSILLFKWRYKDAQNFWWIWPDQVDTLTNKAMTRILSPETE